MFGRSQGRGPEPANIPAPERSIRALLLTSMGINQESDAQRVAAWISDFAVTFLAARLAAVVILNPSLQGAGPSVHGALDGYPLDPGTASAVCDMAKAEISKPLGTNLFLDDLTAIAEFAGRGLRFGLRTRMRTVDVNFGALILGFEEEPTLGADDRFFLTNLTNQGAVALGRIQTKHQIEKREAELGQLTDRLERANIEMSGLASGVAHDLAEPLRQVASAANLVARRLKDRADPEIDEYLGFAREGVVRMRMLVEALSEYSRVGTSERAFGPADGDGIVGDVIRMLSPTMKKLGATMTADPLPQVWGDPVEIGRVFQNLLANALRFARPGAPPVVHISATRREGEWRFAVADNGAGIDPQDHDRIFHIFERGRRHTTSGTGIGLATCRRIVERHGGRIWVESIPDRGSTFHFTIPDRPKGFQKVSDEP